eukprot:scaffold1123_cov253-Pinguiococcus_pyrenoidosus.AAC.8
MLLFGVIPDRELHSGDVRRQLKAELCPQDLQAWKSERLSGAAHARLVLFVYQRLAGLQACRKDQGVLRQALFTVLVSHQNGNVVLVRQLPHDGVNGRREDGGMLVVLLPNERGVLLGHGHNRNPWERCRLRRLVVNRVRDRPLALVLGRRQGREEEVCELRLRLLGLFGSLKTGIIVIPHWNGEQEALASEVVKDLRERQVHDAPSLRVAVTRRDRPRRLDFLHLAEKLMAVEPEEADLHAIVDGNVMSDALDLEKPILVRLLLRKDTDGLLGPHRVRQVVDGGIVHETEVALLALGDTPKRDEVPDEVRLIHPSRGHQQERPREVGAAAVGGKRTAGSKDALRRGALPVLSEIHELDSHPPQHHDARNRLVLRLHGTHHRLPMRSDHDNRNANASLLQPQKRMHERRAPVDLGGGSGGRSGRCFSNSDQALAARPLGMRAVLFTFRSSAGPLGPTDSFVRAAVTSATSGVCSARMTAPWLVRQESPTETSRGTQAPGSTVQLGRQVALHRPLGGLRIGIVLLLLSRRHFLITTGSLP